MEFKSGLMFASLGAVFIIFKSTFAGFACLSNPCIHGICIDDLNSTYACYCLDGFTGLQCQTNWDECWSSPCRNGGTCIDGIATYNCSCADGFVGEYCEVNYNECDSNPCQNNGTCVDADNSYSCICVPGYFGTHCEIDIAVCNVSEATRCHHGGVCVEGPGISFNCICTPGWSGNLCQIETDECASSPCQNGGICIDLHADFACACAFGYTGKTCAEEIIICDKDPCKNDAVCLMEQDSPVCYCVPDFHGDRCQYQYDECQLGPRCLNGGTCIDGVDNFTCSCPPDLTGLFCECLILDDKEIDCTYISSTTIIFSTSLFNKTTPTSTTKRSTTAIYETSTKSSTLHSSTSTLKTTPGTSTIIDKTQTMYVTTTSSPGFTETDVPNITSVITKYDISSTKFLPTIFSTTPYGTYTSILYGSEPMSSGITDSTTQISYLETLSTEFLETTEREDVSSTSSSKMDSTSEETTFDNVTKGITKITDLIPSINITLKSTTSEPSKTTEISTKDTSPLVTTQKITDMFTTSTKSTEIVNTTSKTIFTTLNITYIIPNTTGTTPSTTLTTPSKIYTIKSRKPTIATNVTEMTSSSQMPIEISSELSSELTTENDNMKTPKSIDWTVSSITVEPITDSFYTITDETTSEYPFFEKSTMFTEITSYGTTLSEESTTDVEIVTAIPIPDCSVSPCKNGGTCILTIDGHKCFCPFDAEGPLCETPLGIRHVAFTGNSYLSYKIEKLNELTVELKTNTFNSDGIIFFADMERTYMVLYVQNGLPKFQFSCGFQTMLLSELEVPVNTGNDMFIKANLKFADDYHKCNAVLTVNNTLHMSGEQVAFLDYFSKKDSWLHLGGIPKEYDTDFMDEIPGFTGCIENIKINGKTQNILKDALDGFKLTECSSLACLSNPCQHGATCIENDKNWICQCQNGYIGKTCQTTVCKNNPCQFGATCVPYTGSGYLCLCPFGKHGFFCEKDLMVTEPMFSSSVHGLSSFAGYNLPTAMSNNMELTFKIKPNTLDQIALLLFIGQHGFHDSTSDHMSVSYVKGYIVLTWNLGSGPRRIFTTKPLDIKDNLPHVIHLGRYGRRAWLKVDHYENITGRSPGKLVHLDVLPIIYLGGHYSTNFSMLPHDLPLHTGFSGCIYDVRIKTGSLIVPLQAIAKPTTGRSLGQCGMIECHDRACQNGGVCLQHGPTFTCMCQDGWFGPFCSLSYNPCNMNRNNCSEGSTCVPLVAGYECDCPIGKTGQYCNKDEQISDLSFTGKRSYILLDPGDFNSQNFVLEFEIRPLGDYGIVLFIGILDEDSYLSALLQGNSLEIRISSGKYNANNTQPLIVRSSKLLAIGVWQSVRIAVSGRKVILSINGVINRDVLESGDAFVLFKPLFYIGGVPDLSGLPNDAVSSVPLPFTGCIRNLHLNEIHIPLIPSRLMEARNVEDCDGTPCGGEVCKNGGSCWLDSNLTPRCSCTPQYTGDRCELREACSKYGCENNGQCIGNICTCSVGWSGSYCEIAINLNRPRFLGNSYLSVKQNKMKEKRNLKFLQNVPFVHLNFSTASPNGMVLWSAKGEDFFGIGIDDGHLKLVWTSADSDIFVIEVPAVGRISDGIWHEIKMSLDSSNITVWVDQIMFHRQIKDPDKENLKKLSYPSDRIFFLGGIPNAMSVKNETFGFFQSNFVGCIELLSSEWNPLVNDFSNFNGENIANCDLY